MLYRALLTAIAISCTFSRETIVNTNAQSTKSAIKDLICVLFLSGIQKEDLDVTLMRKLERRNVNLNNLNNEKIRQECYKKFYQELGQLPKNSSETSVNIDLASKENITKASLADLLDTSELESLLQRLKNRNKHNTAKYTPERNASPQNRTNANKNINVELKSIKYKIEIVTKRPVTEKVETESDNRGLPTLSNVIKFWKMYMQSNKKSNKEYYSDETTTIKVTPEPRHSMNSEEAERISKVLESFVLNKGTNSDQISGSREKEINRFSNYQHTNGPQSVGRRRIINENYVPNKENIVSLNRNGLIKQFKVDTLNDLSFKGLLNNIYTLLSTPKKSNENKLSRIEINTPKYKTNKNDIYEQKLPKVNSVKDYKENNGINNNLLNNKFTILRSLLSNFQIDKFKDNGDILARITRLEQMGKDERPLSTSPLKGNSSERHKVPSSHLTDLLYGIMNEPVTAPSLENMNYLEENIERYQELLQQHQAPSEKNEHYEKFIQQDNAAPAQNNILLEPNNELPQKLIHQFETQPVKYEKYFEHNTEAYHQLTPHYNALPEQNKNYFEQKIEQYQKIIHHNAPVKSVNYFEPNTKQEKLIPQYNMPLNSEPKRNQTLVYDYANNGHAITQSSTPERQPLKEIAFTTPVDSEKFLHPDVVRQIAESVKQLVLNDIQDRLLLITKPTITTELTTKSVFANISNAIKLVTTTVQPIPTTTKSLNDNPNDEIVIGTTVDMFAASLTKVDSEKLKQATLIIEKFIELFKHIKLMQEIKSMAIFTTPDPPKATLKELSQIPQDTLYPVLMHSAGYFPPSPLDVKLQAPSNPYDFLHQQNLLDLMLQARGRALDLQLQPAKPQQIVNVNTQDTKLPTSFDPRLQPQFPFEMKIQPPKILPVIVDPYDQSLQPLPIQGINVNQPHVINDIPNVHKLNKAVTIRQTEGGAIDPIQMVNPVDSNNNIVLSSPVPLGLTKADNNRWNIMIKYGNSQADINDLQNRKHMLSRYSNMKPNHTENSNSESGSTQQNLFNNNVPLFKQHINHYIDDFKIDINPKLTSKATRQDSIPQIKNDVNNSNSDQTKKDNPKNSNFQGILAEVDKIAKMFGYKSKIEDKTKCYNKEEDNNDQSCDKIAKVLGHKSVIEDKIKYSNLTEDVNNRNKNRTANFMSKNDGNAFEARLNNKKNPSVGINYQYNLNPHDYRSKLDSRFLHLDQMAHILRANDKKEVLRNLYKMVYPPQKLNNIYTRRKSPGNNFAYKVNLGDNVMVDMDSIKNKERREKGISLDRRFNSGDANLGKIPLGYHEKLERFEEKSHDKDKDWSRNEERVGTPDARPSAPISSIKPLSKYNDAPFQNFLKTQQKVNKILERLLATRTDDVARSTETI